MVTHAIWVCVINYESLSYTTQLYVYVLLILVKKHGKKEPQSFFHCGSFDHPNLQSLTIAYLFFGGVLQMKI